MNKIFLTLLICLLFGSPLFSETNFSGRIENSKFVCEETSEGNLLKKINKQEELVAQNFTKVIRRQKRIVVNLRIKRKNAETIRAKKRFSKRLKKNRGVLKALNTCKKNEAKEKPISREQLITDCTGDFDVSWNEDPIEFTVINGEVAIMRGVITPKIINKVKNLIANNPNLRTIVMTNMPGSDSDSHNLIASRLIRKANIATCVPNKGEIASGAVDFFLAGTARYLGVNSFVGVHSWVSARGVEGSDLPRDHKGHNLYLNYFRDISVDPEFYFFTIYAAPANGIHDMTNDERSTWDMETE